MGDQTSPKNVRKTGQNKTSLDRLGDAMNSLQESAERLEMEVVETTTRLDNNLKRNRDCGGIVAVPKIEQERATAGLRERNRAIFVERTRQQTRAGINARKMSCDCCEGINGCTLRGMYFNLRTRAWEADNPLAEPRPMTENRALKHARILWRNMISNVSTEEVWFKCVFCGNSDKSNLSDMHYGKYQRDAHVAMHHRVEVRTYKEICGTRAELCEKWVTDRFRHILLNLHKDEYDDQLAEIKRTSIRERNARIVNQSRRANTTL